MSTSKLLLKFAKKGINLSPEAYNRVINAENPTDFASSLIVKLKSDKFTSKDLVSVSGEMVDEILGIKKPENINQKTLIDEENTTPKPPEASKTPSVKKTEPKIEEKPKIQTPQKTEEKPKKTSIDDLKK